MYKYIKYDELGQVCWESGQNRKVNLRSFAGDTVIIVDDLWDQVQKNARVDRQESKQGFYAEIDEKHNILANLRKSFSRRFVD